MDFPGFPISFSDYRRIIFPEADLLSYYTYCANWFREHGINHKRSSRWEAELILEILQARALRNLIQ